MSTQNKFSPLPRSQVLILSHSRTRYQLQLSLIVEKFNIFPTQATCRWLFITANPTQECSSSVMALSGGVSSTDSAGCAKKQAAAPECPSQFFLLKTQTSHHNRTDPRKWSVSEMSNPPDGLVLFQRIQKKCRRKKRQPYSCYLWMNRPCFIRYRRLKSSAK